MSLGIWRSRLEEGRRRGNSFIGGWGKLYLRQSLSVSHPYDPFPLALPFPVRSPPNRLNVRLVLSPPLGYAYPPAPTEIAENGRERVQERYGPVQGYGQMGGVGNGVWAG